MYSTMLKMGSGIWQKIINKPAKLAQKMPFCVRQTLPLKKVFKPGNIGILLP